jgi:hypothetical protein
LPDIQDFEEFAWRDGLAGTAKKRYLPVASNFAKFDASTTQ